MSTEHDPLFSKLEHLAQTLKVRGSLTDNASLPRVSGPLSLDTLCILKLMLGETDKVKKCLALGVDPNHQNQHGISLVKLAKAYGYKDIETMLVEHGATPTDKKRPRQST